MQQLKDEELFFEAMNQLASSSKDDPNNELLLAAMTAIFTKMPPIDIPIGDKKND